MTKDTALTLFAKLEAMTVTMEGDDPKAEDGADREDVIEPMFDVRLDAGSYKTANYLAVRDWRLRVKWSNAEGLMEADGNGKLREVIDLATEAGGEVRLENSALEIV
jgi:hypothetical protein